MNLDEGWGHRTESVTAPALRKFPVIGQGGSNINYILILT